MKAWEFARLAARVAKVSADWAAGSLDVGSPDIPALRVDYYLADMRAWLDRIEAAEKEKTS